MSEAQNAVVLDRIAAAFAEALGYQVSPNQVADWRPPAGAQGALVDLSGAVEGTIAVVLDAKEIAKYGDEGRAAAAQALEVAAATVPGVKVAASTQSEIPMLRTARALTEEGNVSAVIGWAASAPSASAPAAAPAAPQIQQTPIKPVPASSMLGNMRLLHDVRMRVTAELGRAEMSVRELLDLSPGSVIELDRIAGSPIDVLVNNKVVARGEVVVIDEEFGVRITEILAVEEG